MVESQTTQGSLREGVQSHQQQPTKELTMYKLTTRLIYITHFRILTPALMVLLGTPFWFILNSGSTIMDAMMALGSGLILSMPVLLFLNHTRESNKFWRLLGECRDLLDESANLSDLNWLENGLMYDLEKLVREEGTREAQFVRLTELQRLRNDVSVKRLKILSEH